MKVEGDVRLIVRNSATEVPYGSTVVAEVDGAKMLAPAGSTVFWDPAGADSEELKGPRVLELNKDQRVVLPSGPGGATHCPIKAETGLYVMHPSFEAGCDVKLKTSDSVDVLPGGKAVVNGPVTLSDIEDRVPGTSSLPTRPVRITKIPEGTWRTDLWGEIEFDRDDKKLIGSYNNGNGHLNLEISDDEKTITGTWRDEVNSAFPQGDRNNGQMELTNPDGKGWKVKYKWDKEKDWHQIGVKLEEVK